MLDYVMGKMADGWIVGRTGQVNGWMGSAELSRPGRKRTRIIAYQGARVDNEEDKEIVKRHSKVKEVLKAVICYCCHEGDGGDGRVGGIILQKNINTEELEGEKMGKRSIRRK